MINIWKYNGGGGDKYEEIKKLWLKQASCWLVFFF